MDLAENDHDKIGPFVMTVNFRSCLCLMVIVSAPVGAQVRSHCVLSFHQLEFLVIENLKKALLWMHYVN